MGSGGVSCWKESIGRKWVLKKKMNVEVKVEKYKAPLVAKGYSQVSGIDRKSACRERVSSPV